MRHPDHRSPVDQEGVWGLITSLIAFLMVYGVLLVLYRPDLIFSLTTTTGGDTGAYHYPMQVLTQDLLPHFRLTGWAPGWYAGMPMFTFYFPFPFLLIAALQWLIPYQIAFKVVTVLGVFALPAVAYVFARLLRVRRPYPTLAAVFALGFLFMLSYSIYGGNVLSTLAGEFSYMLSFAACFLFLGTLSLGMMRGSRFDWLFGANCVLLLVIVLSHIVTTMVLMCLVWGLLLVHRRLRAFLYLACVGAVGFALSAFWSIPFLADLEWSAKMVWPQLHSLHDLLPAAFLPVAVLGVVGMAYAGAKKDRRGLPLAWITFASLVLIYVLPNGRLWNARVMPFFWFSFYLWAAYAFLWFARPFAVVLRALFRVRELTSARIYVPLVALVLGAGVLLTSQTTAVRLELQAIGGAFGVDRPAAEKLASETPAAVIEWNYTGFEGKSSYGEYRQINDFIAGLPAGRVMVEHSLTEQEFGTERGFELIPYWTGAQATMEGTLMESSFTAPFHFVNQAELSLEPSDAITGVKYPTLNVSQGLTHLQLMGIAYLLTVTPEVANRVQADERATLLDSWGGYHLFRIAGAGGYVQVMKNQPVRLRVPQGAWRNLALEWYENPNDLATPLVWDQGEKALQPFGSVSPSAVTSPPLTPTGADGTVTNERLTDETLSFDTTAIGVPHLIKVSYFPNWHSKGAKGPYLVSPSFMMVIPTQSHVTLYYGRTNANTFGQVLEVIGWLVLVGIGTWRGVCWWKGRRSAAAKGGVERPHP